MNFFRLLTIVWVMVLIGLFTGSANAQSRGRVDQFTLDCVALTDEILASVTDAKTLKDAISDAHQLGDYVSAHAGARQLDAMVRAESVLSMLSLVGLSKHDDPAEVVGQFADSPAFTTELGLLVVEQDNAKAVVRVAMELMTQREAEVEKFPALAAAVCVVHDMQDGEVYSRWVNEHTPEASDPIAIFDFFTRNARTMSVRPDALPACALVYVVDVTESIEQLQWAHDRFHTNPAIKDRFFEIEYDYQHFLQGKPKRVVTAPGEFNLQKINQYGGVCADQAYYSMSVAKACGLPSGYVIAKGADLSHAWVGFVETRGRRAVWNFNAGRYKDYQKLRGNMVNPQMRESISDGRAGILSGAMSARNDDVLAALAAARVVERMRAGIWRSPEEMDLEKKGNARIARTDSVEDQLVFLRSTLSKCAGVPRAWDQVVALAESGKLSEKQMDVWSRAVMQLAGRQHQDFAYDFLVSMISTVDNPQRQHEMWEWAFGQFRTRPDLAAGARFMQGELWFANDNLEYAWIAYQDVLNNFLNDGPMMNDALQAMGRMLAQNGKRRAEFLPLLQEIAKKVQRPDNMLSNFAKQSNYYKVHWRLVKELEYHNRGGEAKRIRDMINMPEDE